MLKRLAILAGTLAALATNVALAEPTINLGGSRDGATGRAEGTAPPRTSSLPHTVTPPSDSWTV